MAAPITFLKMYLIDLRPLGDFQDHYQPRQEKMVPTMLLILMWSHQNLALPDHDFHCSCEVALKG